MKISGTKQLDIVLPSTNKALKEVLRSVSPQELEVITKSKDLKSIISSILNQSSKSSASDKILLQLLKNNPTLKDLGNVSTTIKELLNSLKVSHEPMPMEKILNKFIADMNKLSDMPTSDKHTHLNKSSNTIIESKLLNIQNSQTLSTPNNTQASQNTTTQQIPKNTQILEVLQSTETPKNTQNTKDSKPLQTPPSIQNAQNIKTPQHEIKETLKSLLNVVEKSSSFEVKSLSVEIKSLINNEALKNPSAAPTPLSQAQLSKGIENVIKNLQSNIKDVDVSSLKDVVKNSISDKIKTPLHIEKVLKEFLGDVKQLNNEGTLKSKITDSGLFLESKLKNAQNPQVELKEVLKSLQIIVEKSSVYPVKYLSKNIDTLLSSDTLKNASNSTLTQPLPDDKKALVQLVKGLENIISTIKTNLKDGDSTTTQTFNTLIEKIEHKMQPKLLTPENFKLPSIQETIQQVIPHLQKSALPEAKGLLDALVKILQIKPNTTLEQFTKTKAPIELQSAMQPLKVVMNKADPLFSKDIGLILNKLDSLNSLQKLSSENNIKDILSNDLKALLLKTTSEIANSSNPNQAEILKNLDKLSLQIDYFQLMSHLSNSSSIYLPFSWDALEQGNINLKKGEDEKFYCDIELKLKEYGELSLKLVLYEENQINIKIYSDNSEFKEIVKENISSLRSALIESHITPREIRILDASKKVPYSPYESSTENINVGFEIKA